MAGPDGWGIKNAGDLPRLPWQRLMRVALGEAVVRQWGEVAVSTGGYVLTWPDPAARRVPARFSFVYHRSAAGWRIVDHHSSAMPDPQAVLAAATR